MFFSVESWEFLILSTRTSFWLIRAIFGCDVEFRKILHSKTRCNWKNSDRTPNFLSEFFRLYLVFKCRISRIFKINIKFGHQFHFFFCVWVIFLMFDPTSYFLVRSYESAFRSSYAIFLICLTTSLLARSTIPFSWCE